MENYDLENRVSGMKATTPNSNRSYFLKSEASFPLSGLGSIDILQ